MTGRATTLKLWGVKYARFTLPLFVLCSLTLGAQTLTVRPEGTIPFQGSEKWFELGGGLGVSLGTGWKGTPLRVAMEVEALVLPLKAQAGLVVLAAGGPMIGLEFEPNPDFSLTLEGGGGWYVASFSDFWPPSHNPYATGGARMNFFLAPTLGFSLGVRYQYAWGLFQAVAAYVGFQVGERP